MRTLLPLLLVTLLAGPAGAVSGRACRQACADLIAQCGSATTALGFGNLGRSCKKAVVKRCRREGIAACGSFCGDGVAGPPEACDGADFAGATCRSHGFADGTLGCTLDCRLDLAGCRLPSQVTPAPGEPTPGPGAPTPGPGNPTPGPTGPMCGDRVRQGAEECDGADLSGLACTALGFIGGELACSPACALDTADCDSVPVPVDLPVDLPAGDVGLWDEIGYDKGLDLREGILIVPDRNDAHDGFWRVAVDGVLFDPGNEAGLSESARRRTIFSSPQTMSGLQVTMQATAFRDTPTLRIVASFENPTAAPIAVAVTVSGDLGSDSETVIEASASGDTTFDAADRWLVTSDGVPFDDPVNGFVFAGPGDPPVRPGTATLVGDIVSVDYALAVPPGATRHLVFFGFMAVTPEEAVGRMDAFATDTTDPALLGSLPAEVRANVVNWP